MRSRSSSTCSPCQRRRAASFVAFVEAEGGRGELCQAVERAILDADMRPVNLGPIPTPALTYYALSRHLGSIMVTGSHIPFHLNGYKLNTSAGELLKEHEGPIGEMVAKVRARVYAQAFDESPFNECGMFKTGHQQLSPVNDAARMEYIDRYQSFFSGSTLRGRRILVYQHSAVARDVLVDLLEHFGAEVIPRGRSDKFVAIDTEAIDDAQLAELQAMADEVALVYGPLWAVVSTDGDSDRPLILGVEARKLRFFGGDLLGMVVAEYLGADAVVVPISCNDAIDRSRLASVLEPKTRIGSPYVIAGMGKARRKGAKVVCGWEANGGFLLGSDIERSRRVLKALPTRDAILPILAVLFSARGKNISLPTLFSRLPNRYSRAGLLRNFPRAHGRRIVELLTAAGNGNLAKIISQLEVFFRPEAGFSAIARIDYTDGVRIIFANGDVAHFRPSGNADEFRIYAVADTQARANEIVQAGIAEPEGIIRSMERTLIA
jgi:phosphomannomutase